MIVAVGSTNPAKVAAIETAFKKCFADSEDINFESVKVDSGVPDQPLTDEETLKGAINRARAALKTVKQADFGVGIEGGASPTSLGFHEKQWVVVISRDHKMGVGSSPGVILPKKLSSLLDQGLTIDQGVEKLTGMVNVGQKDGLFGFLTDNRITRGASIEQGTIFALARFLHPDLF